MKPAELDHTIVDDDDRMVAKVYKAEPPEIEMVLNAPTGTTHGRSEWYWLRLADGTLALAVFPQGDTYEALEELQT